MYCCEGSIPVVDGRVAALMANWLVAVGVNGIVAPAVMIPGRSGVPLRTFNNHNVVVGGQVCRALFW